MKITIASFMIFAFVVVFLTAKAESFDVEAISHVSKTIAEWKLMNEGKEQTQFEQTVYVSSSLSGMVEKGEPQGIGVIRGLAAFDNDYWIELQIRQWELNTGIKASNIYISSLPTNPWSDILISIGSELTIRGMGSIYNSMGETFNEIAAQLP